MRWQLRLSRTRIMSTFLLSIVHQYAIELVQDEDEPGAATLADDVAHDAVTVPADGPRREQLDRSALLAPGTLGEDVLGQVERARGWGTVGHRRTRSRFHPALQRVSASPR